MTLLEPWVIVRLLVSAVTAMLVLYGAIVGARVLKYAHVEAATEGQLLLERHFELAANLVRLAAMAQLFALVLSIVTADRLSGAIRGAMCGYAVVEHNRWGWPSVAVTATVSLASGVLLQLLALDRSVRGLDLMRPLAFFCIALAPAALLDLALVSAWLTNLDLSVVSSCCSTTLDAGRRAGASFWQGPRALSTWGAGIGIGLAIAAAIGARRRPARGLVSLAGATTLAVLPFALGAVILLVAPHVYEVPEHLCPFCLFKAEAFFIGYPLFGAIFVAASSGIGGAAAAVFATGPNAREAFPSFARSRMARQAFAWGLVLVLGIAPVALYALGTPGASLFR